MKIKPLLLQSNRRELIYPETNSRRSLPSNFEVSDLGLFEHELERTIPATAFLQFEHCRVAGNGMMYQGIRVFEESFGCRNMLDEWATPKNMLGFFVAQYAFKKVQTCEEDAVLFTDNWSGAYFHWITDALTRLHALGDTVKGATILLPTQYRQFEYTLPSLAPFGIGATKYLDNDHVLLCEKLIVPTHTAPSGNYNARLIRGLRDIFISHFGGRDLIPSAERVYISRRKAKVRRIVNESDVDEVLKQYGFITVCFEDLKFAQQVRIAANARYIISNHGAGLTNILFMPSGGSVLELRKAGDSHNNCYFALASSLDLRYFYQLCNFLDPGANAYSADLIADTGRLKRNLDLMLAK